MQNWVRVFNAKDSTLTIKGKTLHKTDYSRVGEGGQKTVFKINDQNLCFFIPRGRRFSRENWSSLITSEKSLLDHIISLGLKAQQFEIVPLTVTGSNGESYFLDVLLAYDLKSLCQRDSLVIYDQKCGAVDCKRIFGTPISFYALKDRFNDQEFVRKLIEKIINEFAIAITFRLPIKAIKPNLDDSEHYYFELPEDPNDPPVAHYIFWDVANDFDAISVPLVPLYEELKASIDTLAHDITYTICSIEESALPQSNLNFYTDRLAFNTLECAIKSALNDEKTLNESLAYARESASDFIIKNYLNDSSEHDTFMDTMKSLILTVDCDSVETALFSHAKSSTSCLSRKNISTLKAIASQHAQKPMVDFFEKLQKDQMIRYGYAAITASKLELLQNILAGEATFVLSPENMEDFIQGAMEYNNPHIIDYLKTVLQKMSTRNVLINRAETAEDATQDHTIPLPTNQPPVAVAPSFFIAIVCRKTVGLGLLVAGLIVLSLGLGSIALTITGATTAMTGVGVLAYRFFTFKPAQNSDARNIHAFDDVRFASP